MSILYLVRHGQASFGSTNYDQLSSLGEEQGRVLGEYWTTLGVHVDQVYIGPRKRHAQTQAAVAAVYHEKGLPWPEPELIPEFDEHQGFQVMQHMLPTLTEQDPELQVLAAQAEAAGSSDIRPRLKILRHVFRLWMRREFEVDGFEDWTTFRARVREGLQLVKPTLSQDKQVAVFTSTGPVAIGAAEVLRLNDETALELSWPVRNGSFSEFRLFGDELRMNTYNATSHFPREALLTYV